MRAASCRCHRAVAPDCSGATIASWRGAKDHPSNALLGPEQPRFYEHDEFTMRAAQGIPLAPLAWVTPPRALQNWRGARRVLRRTPLHSISRPVSRVLYGLPLETADVTTIPLAHRLPGASSNLPERLGRTALGQVPRRSYSVLLPVGFAVPLPLPASAVRSYRTVSPLPRLIRNAAYGGLFSVALSLKPPRRAAPPDVIRHRSSMEPGLSSPAAFRHWRGAAVRPTDSDRDGVRRGSRQAGRTAAVKKGPDLSGGGQARAGCHATKLGRIDKPRPAAGPKLKRRPREAGKSASKA
jgi:hypothetical protein